MCVSWIATSQEGLWSTYDMLTEGGENRDNKINMDSDFKVLTNETTGALPSYSEAKIRCELSAEGVYRNLLLLIAVLMGAAPIRICFSQRFCSTVSAQEATILAVTINREKNYYYTKIIVFSYRNICFILFCSNWSHIFECKELCLSTEHWYKTLSRRRKWVI